MEAAAADRVQEGRAGQALASPALTPHSATVLGGVWHPHTHTHTVHLTLYLRNSLSPGSYELWYMNLFSISCLSGVLMHQADCLKLILKTHYSFGMLCSLVLFFILS